MTQERRPDCHVRPLMFFSDRDALEGYKNVPEIGCSELFTMGVLW